MDSQDPQVEPAADSNNRAPTTNDTNVEPKSRKLRQTCEACREAKIKCDKGSPRCRRCERLSFKCVYSPARHFGRPRPSSQRTDENIGSGSGTGDARGADHGSRIVTNENNSAPAVTTAAGSTAPQTPSFSTRPALHRNSSSLATFQSNRPRSDSYPAAHNGQPGATNGTDSENGNNNCSDQINDIVHGGHPTPNKNNSNVNGRVDDFAQNASSDCSWIADIDIMSSLDKFPHNPYEYDCATVAVATIRELSEWKPTTDIPASAADNTHPGSVNAVTAAHMLAEQIPHASRQAARILVCACAADTDTALLVASLVTAILEGAGAALRALDGGEQQALLVFGTLPCLSRVVTLFGHRYSVTQTRRPPQALLLLAASLKTTLKTLAGEMTDRFLDGTSDPSLAYMAHML